MSQTHTHIDAFTHKLFYSQQLVHTEAFTYRSFYRQALLHSGTLTQLVRVRKLLMGFLSLFMRWLRQLCSMEESGQVLSAKAWIWRWTEDHRETREEHQSSKTPWGKAQIFCRKVAGCRKHRLIVSMPTNCLIIPVWQGIQKSWLCSCEIIHYLWNRHAHTHTLTLIRWCCWVSKLWGAFSTNPYRQVQILYLQS